MPEINYKDLNSHLQKESSQLYLIYGEELLCKTAVQSIADKILPDTEHEIIEGINENIPKLIHQINTFSMFSDKKIIIFSDCQIFQSKQDSQTIIQKTKEAFDSDNIKKASTLFLSLLGLLNISFEELKNEENKSNILGINSDELKDQSWIDSIIQYSVENERDISKGVNYSDSLQNCIEKGFPKGNFLIISAEIIDKRKSLYKTIKEKGLVVDCSIPKGERKADKIAQEKALQEKLSDILEQSGKTIEQNARSQLMEMTGFDLRTFANNLEKLIVFIGKRKKITIEDVRAVLKRTKRDPLYEFTNAITDRNIEKSIFYMKSLISGQDSIHPLQLLAAITNQIRKLLNVKGFIKSDYGRVWNSAIGYREFQDKVIPEIEKYDKKTIDMLEQWEEIISDTQDKKETKNKSKKISTDIIIAKNPNNAYPIYQIFKKSDFFLESKLISIIKEIHKADSQMKGFGGSSELTLENLIFLICIGN